VNQKEIAEFVGIMLGDGSIGLYNTHAGARIKLHRVVKVTLDSRNKVYTDYVANLMERILDIKPKIHYKKKENAVDLKVHKKDKFLYVLNEIGLELSPKWGRMKVPEPYTRGKLGLLVLKGLFDTDGCLAVYNNNGTIYPRIEIRMSPSPAQNQISAILDEFGFNYRIQNLERGKTRIRISGKTELKRWFKLIGSSNPTHINKSKAFLNS
jgi:hypothetical protein